jgi:hypothetical protein
MQQQHQMQMQMQQQQMWPSYLPYGDPIVRPSAAAAAGLHHHAGLGVMGPAGLRVAAPDTLTAQQYNYFNMQYSQQYGLQYSQQATAAEEAVTNCPRIDANKSTKARAAGSRLEAADGKIKKKPQSRQKPNNKQRAAAPGSPRLEGVAAPMDALDGLEGLLGAAGECRCLSLGGFHMNTTNWLTLWRVKT